MFVCDRCWSLAYIYSKLILLYLRAGYAFLSSSYQRHFSQHWGSIILRVKCSLDRSVIIFRVLVWFWFLLYDLTFQLVGIIEGSVDLVYVCNFFWTQGWSLRVHEQNLPTGLNIRQTCFIKSLLKLIILPHVLPVRVMRYVWVKIGISVTLVYLSLLFSHLWWLLVAMF